MRIDLKRRLDTLEAGAMRAFMPLAELSDWDLSQVIALRDATTGAIRHDLTDDELRAIAAGSE